MIKKTMLKKLLTLLIKDRMELLILSIKNIKKEGDSYEKNN